MMQSDHPGLRAARLPAVKQCAVPRAVKQSTLPRGRGQGGDGAETGDTVKVRLRRKIFRVGGFFFLGWGGGVGGVEDCWRI